MDYKNITPEDIRHFEGFIDPQRIFHGEEISEDYSHDEMGGIKSAPELLIKVTSTDEVSRIMAYANEQHIPVVVRGSGTGLVGAAVPLYGGILLETTLMNNILELDKDNLTVTVQTGVLLMELSKYVEAEDLFYPPDPGEKTATIGGNISTNAGGMRAVKYGVTRDYVMGLTAVLPTGEVIEAGGKIVKNSTGYSILDLLVGSEGTLAVVTEATLKLLPRPTETLSLLIPFEDIPSAINAVPRIIKSKVIPTAIEFMEQEVLHFAEDYLGKKFPGTQHDAFLLLTFDGQTREQIEREYEKVADLLLEIGAQDVLIVDTDERKEIVWSTRGAFLEAIKASTSEMDECDVVVPRDRVAEFVLFTKEIARDLDVRIPSFGHAGDGNLHVYVCRDDMDKKTYEQKLEAAFDRMHKKSVELRGQVSGEHGIGFAKRKYMFAQLGDVQIDLMRKIKAAFDPNNILNPGKVCQTCDSKQFFN